MASTSFKDRNLLAVIGDEDTVTGLLLAGIGHVSQHQKKNFSSLTPVSSRYLNPYNGHVPEIFSSITKETQVSTIESAFQEFTERKDVAILLINQHVAEKIRPTVDKYQQAFPSLLEIPSKDHPYDPSKDSVLKRVQKLFGE
ncbi:hypothetical protein EW146_g2831 [Bondarzewia mesenterica]|uniref:V-type proton ATPase subunit F n=1 Tax=Bondarzewia mesenterica TaxID=1095465 RepID=A0A4S4M5M2_9AGAM|nr:hypothetical protein EW146_g2831 [Bondarzewia mesenterica]